MRVVDIAEAIAKPGEEVDKSMGDYVTHRDYTTSKEINDFFHAGNGTHPRRQLPECLGKACGAS